MDVLFVEAMAGNLWTVPGRSEDAPGQDPVVLRSGAYSLYVSIRRRLGRGPGAPPGPEPSTPGATCEYGTIDHQSPRSAAGGGRPGRPAQPPDGLHRPPHPLPPESK